MKNFSLLANLSSSEADVDAERRSWEGNIAFAPDGRHLLVAAPDGVLKVRAVHNGRVVAAMQGHGDMIYDVLMAPDGKRLFSAGKDRRIRVWDAERFEPIADLAGHHSYVYALALAPDGTTLVSTSGDGTLRIWETRPVRMRERAIAERIRLTAELQATIEELFASHESAEDVAVAVETDPSFQGRRREVALQLVLARAVAERLGSN